MPTIPDSAPTTPSPWSPITREERDRAAAEFTAALTQADKLSVELRTLAARIREEADHVGE